MKYQISIPEPCHEDWSAMTPNEKGRFCAACSKTVVDFRRMSNKEIVNHLGKTPGKSCGRFSPHQMGEHSIKNNPKWTRWIASVGLMISLFPAPLVAQSNVEKTEQLEDSNFILLAEPRLLDSEINPEIIIRGRVMIESKKEPLEGASVHVEGTTIGAFTNQDGFFPIKMNPILADTSINVIHKLCVL